MYLAIVDPIEAIFDVCDVNGDDGLTLEEVEKDDCMKPLEKLFGLTKLTMTKAFLKIDTNGDHIITKEEGQEAANKNLDRDISPPCGCTPCTPCEGAYRK